MAIEITTEDLFFKLVHKTRVRFVLVRREKVFDMVLEERTDYGHSMADGLDISSKPIVSIF